MGIVNNTERLHFNTKTNSTLLRLIRLLNYALWTGCARVVWWYCYVQVFCLSQQTLFIEKNNDALHASLEFLIQDSSNKMLKTMFEGIQVSSGKLNFISVGSKFRSQLQTLMEKLKSTVSPVVSSLFVEKQFFEKFRCRVNARNQMFIKVRKLITNLMHA